MPLKSTFQTRLAATLVAGLLPMIAFAHSYGPKPRATSAPGDDPLACTSCHVGALNNGIGSVKIVLQGASVYIPGVKQRIVVQVAHPDQQRWGFEMTARPNSNLDKGQAGTLIPIDNTTQVICEDFGTLPCGSGPTFITHTTVGTRNGQRIGGSFQFDWTPPATDIGPVTLYVSGNAANGNGSTTGDFIYTSNLVLSPVSHKAPVASSKTIVAAATSTFGPVTANSWMTVYGTSLAATTRSWNDSDFNSGTMPFSLDGVSVLLNQRGFPRLASVGYVSPTQVNFLLPSDLSTSAPITVQVRNTAGITSEIDIAVQASAPQLFTSDAGSVLATHANGTLVSKSSPAAPSEAITLFGTGLGGTTPALISFQLAPSGANLATLPVVNIGGGAAIVQAASAVPGSAGVYQIRVVVPTNAVSADQLVVVVLGGVESAGVPITVQR